MFTDLWKTNPPKVVQIFVSFIYVGYFITTLQKIW
jgi:hypothetical protein